MGMETGQKVMVPKGPGVKRAEVERGEKDWTRQGRHPALPDWVREVHDHQLDAVERVCKEFAGGARVVMLDAPVGSGKTLVGELVRRELDVARGLYVCTTKSLQAQVVRDFPYARVLKGRTNYTPTKLTSRERDGFRQGRDGRSRGLGVTCADCDAGPPQTPPEDQTCSYCEFVQDCPYTVARSQAMTAPVGVLNTSYLLAECNGPGKFRDRELVVCDEADLLERELLGFVELRVGKTILRELGLEVPKKGSHMTTIRAWAAEELEPGLVEMRRAMKGGDLETRRKRTRVDRLVGDVRRVIEREDGWVRDNDEEGDRSTDGLVLKPVTVEDVGERYLWRHGERWLLMSGTTVSAEGQAEALGLEEAGIPWASVEVPMLFPRENRRVVYAPLASMTRKGQEAGGLDVVKRGVERVLEMHPDVNVLIHTHTYVLAKEISATCAASGDMRPVFTYTDAYGREDALRRFKERAGKGGAVLVASSMDRGVDLPGDLCRVQVIVKVPMASLGSRQVSERLRTRGGQLWYAMETVRSVMQMCGRAVRGKDDWAVTYVLDSHFGKLLGEGKKMGLWPQWWLDGLELGKMGEFR